MSETNNAARPAFAPTGAGWYTLRDGRAVQVEAVEHIIFSWRTVDRGMRMSWFASGCFSVDGRCDHRDIVAPWVPQVGDTVRVVKAKRDWRSWYPDMDSCVGVSGVVTRVYDWAKPPFVELLNWWFPVECIAPVEADSRPADADALAELREQIDRLTEQLAEATSPEGVAKAATELSRQGQLDWTYLIHGEIQQAWHGTHGVDLKGKEWSYAFRIADALFSRVPIAEPPAQHDAARAAGLEEVST